MVDRRDNDGVKETRIEMRVLYLTTNPNRASTTTPTEGWFRLLRAQGLEPVLVSATLGDFHRWACDQQIPSFHVPLPVPSKSRPWPFFHSLWRLRQLVKAFDIQLIHCNEQDAYPIGQYLGRVTGLPVVVSIHFRMPPGQCLWAFSGRRRPRRMFFVSRSNQESCRPGLTGVVPESDWRVLYNGIDLDRMKFEESRRNTFRQAHGVADGEMAIGAACALRPRKQIEHLFQAAAQMTMRGKVRVFVAGGAVSGDEAYVEQLLQSGRALLGDRFTYLGHLSDLRDFNNGLDIAVNTSKEEAFSISVLEALACGCPVVGYASKSVDESILPLGGEIVEQDSVPALTAALDDWAQNPGRLQASRASARRQAENLGDIRKASAQLWSEYQQLAG
jgi:glycosyltransferase involved in cell wall biosynthesis